MHAVEAASVTMGTAPACDALDRSRASVNRRRQPAEPLSARPTPSRALAPSERQAVLGTPHTERFLDQAPAQIHATFLDKEQEVKERRNRVRRRAYVKPELLATQPSQLWSWDIIKLLGPAKLTYFYLYVILDVFSRCVVGWMEAPRESAVLAERSIANTRATQGITPGQLTFHADRGSSMRSKPVALLLADLGVVKTHSRPRVSNDNPFSEAQFKTLKYCPAFPDRFGSREDARAFGQPFYSWYNHEHQHNALRCVMPAMVYYGVAEGVRDRRTIVLAEAFAAHPEHFVRGLPKPAPLPTAVSINPPATGHAVPDVAGTAPVTSAELQGHPLPTPPVLTEAIQ